MYKGWDVDEDQSFDHLISITQCVISHTPLDKPIQVRTSPKSKMRFRTASMPKVEEVMEQKKEVQSTSHAKQQVQEKLSFPQRASLRYQAKQLKPPESRISLRSTLFQNPIEKVPSVKLGRTIQPKFFNPLLRNGEFHQKLRLSRKMKSMSNIFNDERITYKKHDFQYLNQQRSNVVYVALSK